MRKLAFFIVLNAISCGLFSQEWQQIGDLNWVGPRVMYNDSTTGLLFISCESLFNGSDTINGVFAFDGTTFIPLAKKRFDCGNVNCGPALFLTSYGNNIYFSGPGVELIDSASLNGIGKWDGDKWSEGLPGLTGDSFNNNPYIDGYFNYGGKLYLSGYFSAADNKVCNSVAYWDGQQWTGLNFPGNGFAGTIPRVAHVFFYKNELYAAGNFYVYLDGAWVDDIVRYDGVNWHAVGGGLHGGEANIWDWAIYKDELYICGYFRQLDGNAGNKIMRWNGQEWKDVGGGICSPSDIARGLAVIDGKLLLYGIFNCVGNGLPVGNIAAWDGERWCSFGTSTFDNAISRMVEYKGDVYIGGGFREVNGQPCRFFAKYVGDHSTDTCSEPISAAAEPVHNGFSISPNPASDQLELRAPRPIESVWISDALGREMLRVLGSGTRVSVSLGDIPAGLYFVSVRAGGELWGSKLVKE